MLGFKIFKITGHSMEPLIKNGSFVLIHSWNKNYKIGDVVLFEYENKKMLKRIVLVDGNFAETKGDNLNDSLEIPPIKKDQLLGKVIWS